MFYPTHSISMILSALPGEHIKKVSCFGYEDHNADDIYGNGKNYWDNPFSNETALFSLSGGGVMRVNDFRRVSTSRRPTSRRSTEMRARMSAASLSTLSSAVTARPTVRESSILTSSSIPTAMSKISTPER